MLVILQITLYLVGIFSLSAQIVCHLQRGVSSYLAKNKHLKRPRLFNLSKCKTAPVRIVLPSRLADSIWPQNTLILHINFAYVTTADAHRTGIMSPHRKGN